MNICVHSNSVLLILMCSLVVSIQYNFFLDPRIFITYLKEIGGSFSISFSFLVLGAVVLLFYPLAGFLGDVKCGRLKLIKWSLSLLAIGLTIEIFFFFIAYNIPQGLPFVVIVVISASLVIAGPVGFQANIIQFGLDQLQDQPFQNSSLFIHWFWWLNYASMLIAQLVFALYAHEKFKNHPWKFGFSVLMILLSSILLFLICFLYIIHRGESYFVTESRRNNPYKLVYKVTRYAFHHKVPVRRSAFTYCEDELPSRLDLGKEKFGGPFTTEQVEDVKVFYGILKVLVSLGPVFFLEIPSSYMLQGFAQNWLDLEEGLTFLLLKFSSLPLLAASLLLFYLCILRHFIAHLIPSMLKRMGTGFFVELLSLVAIVIVCITREFRSCEIACSINIFNSINTNFNSSCMPFSIKHMMLYSHMAPLVLSALSQLLIYIAMYEFICAQSPHHMKGLLIGLSFAIKGFFKSVGIVLITPFTYWHSTALSCESGYYLTNVVIACVSFGAFVWVAKRYKYRVRDEPSRVRQFAEEYFSKLHEKDYVS